MPKRAIGPTATDGVSKAERKRMKLAMSRVLQDDAKQFDKSVAMQRELRADAGSARGRQTPEQRAAVAAVAAATATSSSTTRRAAVGPAAPITSSKPRHRRQRVLVFASRGITDRHRHLLNDVKKLLPHHRSEAKMDKKDDLRTINEICESQSCNKVLYFEVRKRRDLYMWFANVPHGPSVKFHVVNVHTMDELKLTGNALMGSRPLLYFDAAFDDAPQFKLLKELFTQIWNTPSYHAKSKPFVHHMICFYLVDNKIWFRNYQIVWPSRDNTEREIKLVEIGPRFVLVPVRIFASGFGGAALYQNADYQSPNQARRRAKQAAPTLADRNRAKSESSTRKRTMVAQAPPGLLDDHELFKLASAARAAREAEETGGAPIDGDDDDSDVVDGDDDNNTDDDDDNDDNNDDDENDDADGEVLEFDDDDASDAREDD